MAAVRNDTSCKNRDNGMILFNGSTPADYFRCRRRAVVLRHLVITRSAREGRLFVLSKFGSNLRKLTGFNTHTDVVAKCTHVAESASRSLVLAPYGRGFECFDVVQG
jgi:hypothetical protein